MSAKLTVVVWECRDLKQVGGWRGRNDPYVRLCIGEEEHRTPTIDDGGSAPKWPGSSAHIFTPGEEAHSLDVFVFDEQIGQDDLIGKCRFDLASFPEGDGARTEEWKNLEDANGKKAGAIFLELFWTVRSKEQQQQDDDGDEEEEADPPAATKISDGYPLQHERIGSARDGMTLAQATAYCARMPNCHGMWFEEETGKCEAISIWNPHGTFVPMPCGEFFQIKELPDVLYGPAIVATSLADTESVCFHSTLPLPNSDQLYAEVTFSHSSHPTTTDMGNGGFLGLTNHDDTFELNLISENGAWGFRDDKTTEAIRINGEGSGMISPNAIGRGFSGGDRLGLLVDQRKRRLQLFRNGELIEGAESGGWELGERMWLAACIPSREWTAKWTFKQGYMPCKEDSTTSGLGLLSEAAHQREEEWQVAEADIKAMEPDSDEDEEL
jgi:hypothetical protein